MKTNFTRPHIFTRLMLSLLLVGGGGATFAQIPNSGFEEWFIDSVGVEEPVDWETGNTAILTQVTKSNDAYEGNHSMMIQALLSESGTSGYGWAEADFPISSLPAALKFHVKTVTQSGAVSLTIGFYNEGSLYQEYSWSSTDNISEWSPEVLEFDGDDPVITEAHILVEADFGDFVEGTAMIWIDDLSFETVTGITNTNPQLISVFPNPCDDVVHLKGAAVGTDYSISDITGREVFSGITTGPSTTLDVSELTSGIYLLKLGHGVEESVRKIIVK